MISNNLRETFFFAGKYSACEGASFLDIVRKRPCISGNTSDLVELLSHADFTNNHMFVLTDRADFYLQKDIQSIGLKFLGYLVESSPESLLEAFHIDLWCLEKGDYSILHVETLDGDLERLRPQRAVFGFSGSIHQTTHHGVMEYFQLIQSMERVFVGIPWEPRPIRYKISTADTHNQCSPNRLTSELAIDFEKSSHPNADILKVLTSRRSCNMFCSKSKIDLNTILNLLHWSFSRREDGHLPFPVAGGIGDFSVHLHANRVNGLQDGWYQISSDSVIQPFDSSCSTDNLNTLLLDQEILQNANITAIVSVNFSRVGEKYGVRSYRLACIDTGCLLQTISIVAVNYGLATRIIGGMDEVSIKRVVGIGGSACQVVAGIAIGIEDCDGDNYVKNSLY